MCQFASRAGVAPTSTTASWCRSWPATRVKVPAATSRVPSGVTSSFSTRRRPCRAAVNGTSRRGSTAPVAASRAARDERARPLTAEKPPPTYTRPLDTARSSTDEPSTVARNPATSRPEFRSSLARRSGKRPPTNTAPPPGAPARASTRPPSRGAKPRATAPVSGSKAKSPARSRIAPLLRSRTRLKLPPTTTVFPTTATALTSPSRTSGVPPAGASETTRSCATPAAPAGPGKVSGVTARATAAQAAIRAPMACRCYWSYVSCQ